MTRHFSDPYVERVFDAIKSARTGLQLIDIAAECPEEDKDQLRHALQELRAADAITSFGGKYLGVAGTTAAPSPRAAAPPAPAKAQPVVPALPPAQSAPASTPIRQEIHQENSMPKGQQIARESTIEPRILALLSAGPCLVSTLVERDGGVHAARAIKNGVMRLRAKGQIKNLGGTPHKTVYGLRSATLGEGEIKRITQAPSPQVASAKAKRQGELTAIRAQQMAAALPRAEAGRDKAGTGSHYDPIVAAARRLPVRTGQPAQFSVRPGAQGFRVGLFSDGTLSIVDDDCEMQIDAAKTRALFGYLDQFQSMFGVA